MLQPALHVGIRALQMRSHEGAGRVSRVLDSLGAAPRPRGGRDGGEAGLTRSTGGNGDAAKPDATVPRASGNDAEIAFETAFAAHEQDVVRVCRRILGGREEARDAPQEVYVRARRAWDGFDLQRPFRPWLLAIAGNYCIDRLRYRASEERIFAQLDPEDLAPVEDASASPLGRLLAREQQDAVGRAIAALPLKYRLPLVLRYFSDMDYEGIGQSLGVSRNQVGTLLFRAKQKLREAVGPAPGAATRRRRR